jgi:uncharacterized cupin superfamily protein
MATTSFLTADSGLRDLGDCPIHEPHVIAGAPVARATCLTASPDGGISTHIWDCTAGTFHWHFGVDEIVHILDGEVHVTGDDGHTQTLRAGDVGHFAYGSHTVWDVPQYVRKLAVHRAPSGSVARRVGRKVKRLLV